jgi:hypothetical protein
MNQKTYYYEKTLSICIIVTVEHLTYTDRTGNEANVIE